MKHQNSYVNGQYFSVIDGKLCYFGKSLTETQIIEQAKDVLQKLNLPGRALINNPKSEETLKLCWLSYIFCIASQSVNYERPLTFTRHLNNFSLDEITNAEFVYTEALKFLRLPQNRYREPFDFANDNPYGGMLELAIAYSETPKQIRDKFAKIRWIKGKTSSFWSLCLNGKEFLTLDVHNLRQISGLGINVNPDFYILSRRPNGKEGIRNPSYKQYKAIESKSLEFLNRFPEFCEDGKINGALASSIFWVAGAEAKRRGLLYELHSKGSYQLNLFDQDSVYNGSLKFESPFEF